MLGRLLILLLTILPKHAMSRAAGGLMNLTVPRTFRPAVYRLYSRIFAARPEDAERSLFEYESVNDFFTRALKPGLRPVASDALVSPADSGIGATGTVNHDTLVQAKGRTYSLEALLGDTALARRMDGGSFATFYLAPRDYHRFHSPITGAISHATYIPGHLWPVNVFAVAHVAELFAVNERIVMQIDTAGGGAVAIVFVGATMVGMTRVVFDDLHTNARRRTIDRRTYAPPIPIDAGAQLGHFEFGSTVIVVCSPEAGRVEGLAVGQTVQMGARIGTLGSSP